jgi:hypothetical protein
LRHVPRAASHRPARTGPCSALSAGSGAGPTIWRRTWPQAHAVPPRAAPPSRKSRRTNGLFVENGALRRVPWSELSMSSDLLTQSS